MSRYLKPHNYEVILGKAGRRPADLLKDLPEGVLLNKDTMMYWTEPSASCNGFMLYPRALNITLGNDSRYWVWFSLEDVSVEVAKLVEMRWIDVNGSFRMDYLTPDTKYDVSFVVMMKNASGFKNIKVSLDLELPDGDTQERCLSLEKLKPSTWQEVKIGEFVADRNGGVIKFSLKSPASEMKKGLIIEGVQIMPRPRRHV